MLTTAKVSNMQLRAFSL